MRKYFLSIIILLSFSHIQAQKNQWLFGLNKDSAIILANDVAKNLNGSYTYLSQTEFTDDYKANFLEVLYKNNDTKYSIYFQNFDSRYYIQKLEGSFAEILAIWQKYIDSTATKKSLLNGAVKTVYNGKKELHCLFTNDGGEWSLQFRNIKL